MPENVEQHEAESGDAKKIPGSEMAISPYRALPVERQPQMP